MSPPATPTTFLSIQAQDFIEESSRDGPSKQARPFLSIQAQDFIEERSRVMASPRGTHS